MSIAGGPGLSRIRRNRYGQGYDLYVCNKLAPDTFYIVAISHGGLYCEATLFALLFLHPPS